MTDAHIPEPSQRILAEFVESLDHFSLETLERESGTVYALDRELRLIYFNPAWFRFALENGGAPAISDAFPLGSSLSDAIQGPLHDYYKQHYLAVMQNNKPWQHDYECSSPELYRLYHQNCYPNGRGQMVVIINALSLCFPHPQSDCKADLQRYRNQEGFITQCSHCRRVQRPDKPEQWDWVAEWVRHIPPLTSHSLCYPCYEFYFKFRSKEEV